MVSVLHSHASELDEFDKNTSLLLFFRCFYLLFSLKVFVKATNGLVMNLERGRRFICPGYVKVTFFQDS